MSSSRAMQRLCGLMRKAVQDYEMIAPGDKVMVGVSGGKDSVALTIGLAELRKYIGFDFTVQAVTLDPQFGGKPMDMLRRHRHKAKPCSFCLLAHTILR